MLILIHLFLFKVFLEFFVVLLCLIQSLETFGKSLHKILHRGSHVIVEFLYFCIHRFHALLSGHNLFLGMLDILLVFLRVLLAVVEVQLTFGGEESSKNIWTVSDSGAAILNRWNVADVLVRVSRSILLERQNGVELLFVRNLLELLLVTLNLLFQIFDSLGYTFGNFQVVLDFLHGGSGLGLLESILGEGLMSVLQLSDFLFFEINFGHFPVVIGNLFVVIIISWLLVLLQFVDGLFLFALLIFFRFGSDVLVFFALDDCFGLCLDNLSWVLRLDQSVFRWLSSGCGILLLVISWSDLTNILNLLFGEV